MSTLKAARILFARRLVMRLIAPIALSSGTVYALTNNEPNNKWKLRMSAACIPKNTDTMDDLKMIPEFKEGECWLAGEDASLLGIDKTNASVMAVADGVGGWTKRGIDPSKFSFGLVSRMQALLQKLGHVTPLALLKESYARMISDYEKGVDKPFGSSTACVVRLTSDGLLQTCNLGDSGFMVLRNEGQEVKTVVRSEAQQTRFNCPLQVRLTPEGKYEKETCELAAYSTYSLSPSHWTSLNRNAILHTGDIVIVASDGLFDNLYESEIQEIVKEAIREYGPNENGRLAVELALAANEASLDKEKQVPFNDEGERAGAKKRSGGKPDDISVLVGVIEREDGELVRQ